MKLYGCFRKLKSKPLPENLKYAYLGNNKTFLVIILRALTLEQEARLVREYSETLECMNREINSSLKNYYINKKKEKIGVIGKPFKLIGLHT